MKWAVVLIVGASASCVPLRPTIREARSGTVVDAQTRAPVVGATVRVESYRVATPPGYGGGVRLLEGTEVKTDTGGQWSVPSKHEWTVGILAADGLPLYANVYCVFAEGYVDVIRNPHESWFQRESSTHAESANDQEMDTLLLLERRSPAASTQSEGLAVTRSCRGVNP
jgi:hypothetical protein